MKSLPQTIQQLRGPVLRDVSRSFYLSLRLLPRAPRDPISLAYLLARATDTIADTTGMEIGLRLETLRHLADAIQGIETSDGMVAAFAIAQTNHAERSLLASLPACLRWLSAVDSADREDIRHLLEKITRGQVLDLERFGSRAGVTALETAAELDEYTYLVAGCVGEFWTRICERKLRRFTRRSETEMVALGIAYGKGLQLTNILRDVGHDLRAGRCYLPADELRSANLQPRELLSAPVAAEPLLNNWREKAERGLASGLAYAAAIRNRRVRIATALPALIGMRTLALLKAGGASVFREYIKVPRDEVRSIVWRAILAGGSARYLARQRK